MEISTCTGTPVAVPTGDAHSTCVSLTQRARTGVSSPKRHLSWSEWKNSEPSTVMMELPSSEPIVGVTDVTIGCPT